MVQVLQGLCSGRVSVRPPVYPVDSQQQRRVAGLLLSFGARSRYRSTATGSCVAAAAGSVMLSTEVRFQYRVVVVIMRATF